MTDYHEKPFVSIVILNWNGHEDTLACLKSLALCSYDNFEVIVVDNASTDDSVSIISETVRRWEPAEGEKAFAIAGGMYDSSHPSGKTDLHLVENIENMGFARGNNRGIACAMAHDPALVLLLNNDTVVEPHFLESLVEFFNTHPEYMAATPQIRYYDEPEKIWNCGGRISSLGVRKYYFGEKHISALPPAGHLDITFVTGCALMLRRELVTAHGMLSEKFFFGEEDVEFSLRMKKHGVKMACVLPSLIYHKLGASISKTGRGSLGKIYLYYLNRFIDMKDFMPAWQWKAWRCFYRLYIFALLKRRYGISGRVFSNFWRSLRTDSRALTGVNKEVFDKYVNSDFG